MSENAEEIADYLVSEQSLKEAIEVALNGTVEATNADDNYSLSIWREVKAILRKRVEQEGDK